MTDVRQRFATLDRMATPDLWPQIAVRAGASATTGRLTPVVIAIPSRSRRVGGRPGLLLVAAVLVALVVVAVAIGVGASLVTPPITSPTPPIQSQTPSPSPTLAPSPSPQGTPTVTIGRFVAAGSLVQGRAFHSALALPDGRVLVVGGEGSHVAHSTNGLDSMEVWDPVGSVFSASGQMQRATYGDQYEGPHMFRMNDGRMLLIPTGCDCNPPASTLAQVWDPVAGAQPLENLLVQRVAYTATQLSNGNILIAGGLPGMIGDAITAAEVWDPIADAMARTGPLGHARNGAVATLLNDGRVLILGGAVRKGSGIDETIAPILEAEIWDGINGTFSTVFTFETAGPSSSPGEGLHALTLKDDRVLILNEAGGRVWDPVTNTLSEVASFREARRDFSATLLADGRVLVVGGSDDIPGDGQSAIASTELWSPSTGGFEPGPELTEARAGHTATLLSDGRVLIGGGFRAAGFALDAVASAELWEP